MKKSTYFKAQKGMKAIERERKDARLDLLRSAVRQHGYTVLPVSVGKRVQYRTFCGMLTSCNAYCCWVIMINGEVEVLYDVGKKELVQPFVMSEEAGLAVCARLIGLEV